MAPIDRPEARNFMTASRSTTGGRPRRIPLALAWARPAMQRSRIRLASNSAKAATICSMRRPLLVPMSILSRRDISSTSYSVSSWILRTRCLRLRANRSNFHTTTRSNFRSLASFISRWNAGRPVVRPVALSSYTSTSWQTLSLA